MQNVLLNDGNTIPAVEFGRMRRSGFLMFQEAAFSWRDAQELLSVRREREF